MTIQGPAKRTGRRIVLVLDNGGCFTIRPSRAVLEAARRQVRVVWLPRYTFDRDSFYGAAVHLLRCVRRCGKLLAQVSSP